MTAPSTIPAPDALLAEIEARVGKLAEKVDDPALLGLCDHYAVLKETNVKHRIVELGRPPEINLSGNKLETDYGAGEFISMRNDFLSCDTMREFFTAELISRPEFSDYEVCDVGFWDLDVSTDSGFSWHNDNNWNRFLRPDNRSYHGWFVYSRSADCNSTLAISLDPKYNECNTDVLVGIVGIRGNDVIVPDVVAPLEAQRLTLFPVGSVHRTYRFRPPEVLVGHRLCVSFILHHKGDGLNDAKLDRLTDDELCAAFARYAIEKASETGHYMVSLLENHPRTRKLIDRMADSSA